MKVKKYRKVRDHRHTEEYGDAAHGIRNLKYSVPKKDHILFIMDVTMIIILS